MNSIQFKSLLITIIVLLVIYIIYISQSHNEHLTGQSNEAIQTIAGVYNDSHSSVSFNNVNVTGAANINNVSAETLAAANFKGIIVMWSGSVATIPSGWAFCNGDNGTPDLRSKFIVGASASGTPTNQTAGSNGQPNILGQKWLVPRAVGNQGGEENHTLLINEIPSHSHTYTNPAGANNTNFCYGSGCNVYISNGNQTGNTGGNPDGSTGPHNNMPPFYALAYIMKL